ncbi:MAG: tetratricopeptide repeat protein [Usitatibacter sp.]
MLHRIPMKARLAAALFVALLGSAAAWAAPADDLKEAQKLYQQGKLQPALDKVEGYLKAQPKDPQGRFLKGLLLTEQKRIPEAIQVFTGLTEDFPELPEPYNNLAVLYASQGNYDKAKAALELAIHTHPSYATAHENLGDIYAQLASRAYDRALQLDKTNTTAQVKLAMIKDLFSSQKVAAAAATIPKADAPKVEAPKVEAPKAEAPKPAPPVNVAKVEPKAAPAKASPPPAPAPSSEAKAQVTSVVENWARAWSERDVSAYLAFYAPDFEVPGGASRAAWEKERKERIEKPKSIEVTVQVTNVKMGDNEATVTFRQAYKSDTLKSNNTKTVKLVRVGDRWLIKQERVGG